MSERRSPSGDDGAVMTALAPTAWDTPPAAFETHISILLFVGDRAFKLHKPIATAFLDHSTREKRRQACHEEVEINRRFAPDVYLGVVDIVDESGTPQDHVVAMRRMPAERQLSRILHFPAARRCLAEVAQIVTAAHAGQRPIARSGWGDWRQVRQLWQDGVVQMSTFSGQLVPAERLVSVARLARRFLAGRRPLFQARVDSGWIRDGHGDLLADDIYCLTDGPRILDGLAFDKALRVADTLSDAAFLAMDVESKGHPELADGFLDEYAARSGDRYPASLAHHYLAYRAFVRAKIACLSAQQGRAAKAARARELLSLAEDHLRRAQPLMILIGGPPGTGKSTLARGLADAASLQMVRSDTARKTLAGLDPLEGVEADYQAGLYAPEVSDRVYSAMLDSAGRLLSLGYSVVLDASWSDSRQRARARAAAAAAAADIAELRCDVPPEVARERIVDRRREGKDPSDATVAIADRMREAFGAWPEAVSIDTSGSPTDSLALAARSLDMDLPAPRLGSDTKRLLAEPPGVPRARTPSFEESPSRHMSRR